jgi:general secretion pathway protein E/type IV pilus assembly protein PilB
MLKPEITDIKTELVQLLTPLQASYYSIIPKSTDNGILEFYIADNANCDYVKDELEILFGKSIQLKPIDPLKIRKGISILYPEKQSQSVLKFESEAYLENLISEAYELKCSDIHIETYENNCRVRYRIDGRLIEKYVIRKSEYQAFINKIKIKSNLDIAEKRLPQDGRILYISERTDKKFDIRVSVLPTLYGEKVVLRLLSKETADLDIKELGMHADQLEDYLEAIKKPHGIILISGPTGSGKTTTLYATLKILNRIHSNILTIEDPIEYTMEGVNQVQLKESIGLTFAEALRTFLRQDPDIIMLGEIRDEITAQMAIRAAMTGHLVLSTIHTNSAVETIQRLADMHIAPYLLADTLILSAAQRLVRLLCNHCKVKEPFDQSLYPPGYKAPVHINEHYAPVGCDDCHYTGYKGRKALYELIRIDDELSEKIKKHELSYARLNENKRFTLLKDSAFMLFQNGETSIDEIYPIIA